MVSNHIKTVHPYAFKGLPSLKILYLANNQLTTLEWNAFDPMDFININNIGLQFLASGLSISQMKSGGFQVKSTQNLINSDVSTKTIQFDECRRGAMTLDFMKSGVIAPSMHPPQTEEFLLKHLIL